LVLVRDAGQLADYLERLAILCMDFTPLGGAYMLEVLKG
jgi:hypothetical protein